MKTKQLTILIASLILFSAFTLAITRDEAVISIHNAEADILEMQEAGFSVKSLEDTLLVAKQALERADFADLIKKNTTGDLAETARTALEGLNYKGFTYDEVLKHTEEISFRKKQMYDLSDSFRAFELDITPYNTEKNTNETVGLAFITGFFSFFTSKEQLVDTSESEELLRKARIAFEEERIEESNNLILQAQNNLEEKKADITTLNLLKRSGKNFIEKNWRELLFALTIITLTGLITWKVMSVKKIKNELDKLRIEKKSLSILMKTAQLDRFKRGVIPDTVYKIRMEKYNTKMNDLKQKIPVLEAMLKKNKEKAKKSRK